MELVPQDGTRSILLIFKMDNDHKNESLVLMKYLSAVLFSNKLLFRY